MSVDCASIRIERPADEVFEFMAKPSNLDLWSFGTWKISIAEDDLVTGTSLFNGGTILVRIHPHPESGLIDYAIGDHADALHPRIFARVIPATVVGHTATSSILTLTALRTVSMDEERWTGLISAHAVEVGLIKALLESGHDHRA